MDLLSYPNIGFTDGPDLLELGGSPGRSRSNRDRCEILGLSGWLLPTSRPTGATRSGVTESLDYGQRLRLSMKFGRS